MKNILSLVFLGIKMMYSFYLKIIKYVSKWFIITFILDILLLPIKLIVVLIMLLTKKGRNSLANLGKDFYYDYLELSKEEILEKEEIK